MIWSGKTAGFSNEWCKLERTNGIGRSIAFEGFLKVYLEGHDDDEEEQQRMLPAMKVNEKLLNNYITATERFKTSTRYTEAS
jgi:DNA topoisomerase-1